MKEANSVAPFLEHLAKMFPVKSDREALLAYMAACVQHTGTKFSWAPIIQGVEGSGKTIPIRCVADAIGGRHCYCALPMDLARPWNDWLVNMRFITVFGIDPGDDALINTKSLIANDTVQIQQPQAPSKVTGMRANFMLVTRSKAVLTEAATSRRFAVFPTAQQSPEDLIRDGMTGDYFPDLYRWLRADGQSRVTEFLTSYDIPEALNPARNPRK